MLNLVKESQKTRGIIGLGGNSDNLDQPHIVQFTYSHIRILMQQMQYCDLYIPKIRIMVFRSDIKKLGASGGASITIRTTMRNHQDCCKAKQDKILWMRNNFWGQLKTMSRSHLTFVEGSAIGWIEKLKNWLFNMPDSNFYGTWYRKHVWEVSESSDNF